MNPRTLILLALLPALALSGCASLAARTDGAVAPAASAAAPPLAAADDHGWTPVDVVQDGDIVTFRYTMFDTLGQPLLTNQYAMALVINRTDEGYDMLDVAAYAPMTTRLGDPNATHLFGKAFEAAFIGQTVGTTFESPVIAGNDSITGALGAPVRLPRWFGPFPMEETVPRAAFLGRFPSATEGGIVQLNPRFYVRVLDVGESTVTYRYVVEDGQAVPYPVLGETARLTTVVSEDGATFRDRIDIDEGSGFRRRNDRALNLTHGFYVAQAVEPDAIVLQGLRAPMYAHRYQDVGFVVELISAERRTEG